MDVFKVIGVGLVGAVMTLVLKNAKSELTMFITLATGLLMVILILHSLSEVIYSFNDIVDKSGVDQHLFSGLIKIVGIGYITEYSANICADLDSSSLGKKIQLAGKVTIFLMSMPIVKALIDTVSSIVKL